MRDRLTAEEIETFEQDGVVVIRNAVAPAWLERLLEMAQKQLDNPSRWANDATPGNRHNRLFTDRYLWRDNEVIRAFVHESPCAALAGQAMRSNQVRFYFDHLLVKEPGTPIPTPWHQDVPYWPFLGKQICSTWVALTPASVAGSAMEFVRGSHRDAIYYMPELFGDAQRSTQWIEEGAGERVPDIEAARGDYDIIGWAVEPGDLVLFSAWVLHAAPGNASVSQRRFALSLRWLGDDVVWHPHEGADPTVSQQDVAVSPGDRAHDDDRFPCIWRT